MPFSRFALPLAAVLALPLVAGACVGSDSDAPAKVDGTCYANGTCNSGLICRAGVCQGDGTTDGGTTPTDGGTTPTDGGAFSSGCGTLRCAFLTSEVVASDFAAGTTPAAAGRALCMRLAQAQGIPGDFEAWVSSGLDTAKSRVSPTLGFADRKQVTIVAPGSQAMATLVNPLNVDEKGNTVNDGSLAWTGTLPDGTSGDNCNGFSTKDSTLRGVAGNFGDKSSNWTSRSSTNQCGTFSGHVYCFQK